MKHLSEKTKNILLYVVCFISMALSITSVVLVYSYDGKKNDVATPTDSFYDDTEAVASESDATTQTESTTTEEVEETAIYTDSAVWPPEEVQLDLDIIYQNPELPAGCESVALTMLLNYYGFDLDKTTIASDYLIYSTNGSFVEGYAGNPFTSTGGGIYSPGMTDTANKFLMEQGSDLRAVNISGTSLNNLLPFIAKGTPILIWTTIGYTTPNPSGTVFSYDGTSYQWVTREHCVVLSGYNLETNEVTLYDSIAGITTCDKDTFEAIYDKMWRMAVVLQ
jgi:uncharacterized protein YvpB